MTDHDLTDADWRNVAERLRALCEDLRVGPYPKCLSGEDDACGASDTTHAMSYIGETIALMEVFALHLPKDDQRQLPKVYATAACIGTEACTPTQPGELLRLLGNFALGHHPV